MAGQDRSTVKGERVLLPDGMRAAEIEIADGRIAAIREPGSQGPSASTIDAGSLVVMPGVIDAHVHVNEPGRTEWEGFETATRAAAAGGVTTIIDMPLNAIPATTTVDALDRKVRAMHDRLHVDVGLWGGVVPGNEEQLIPLWDRGVLGFKAFLVPSGVPEFEASDDATLERAMRSLASIGAPLLVHAEDANRIEAVEDRRSQAYAEYLASRPPSAEVAAIERIVGLCEVTGCRVHIVHLAAADALSVIRRARERGLPITVETCPHYLTFAAEEISDGDTVFKCAPPIRGREHRDGLWRALTEEEIDLVATDHSPCPPELKQIERGSFATAWGGIASLELLLSSVWTEAAERGATLNDLMRWLCSGPARLAGLEERKGRIAPGMDADLVIWDPDAAFIVEPRRLHHRHPLTPYRGRRLRGVVTRTIVGGKIVRDDGGAFPPPRGRWIRRGSE